MHIDQIYKEYYRKVYSYIQYRIKNTELSKELTNDVFLRVHKHLQNFDETKAKFSTWIFNITNNIIIDNYRKTNSPTTLNFTSYNVPVEIDGQETDLIRYNVQSPDQGPDEQMIATQTIDYIKAAIQSLKPKHREIATLFFINQYGYEYIANKLNLPLGTLKANLYTARKKLQSKLSIAA